MTLTPQFLASRIIEKVYDKPGGIRLVAHEGQMYEFTGRKYEPVSKWQFGLQTTRHLKAIVKDLEKPIRITKGLVDDVVNSIAAEVVIPDSIKLPCWVPGKQEFAESNLLTFKNGLVSLDAIVEGKPVIVHPHTPQWVSFTELPYEYDAAARCPRWTAFLEQIFKGDKERINLLQEWFGYCLTPDTTTHQFLVMEGEGANGKSVVCAVLEAILGHENVSAVPLAKIGKRFQLVATLGKLANITTEASDTGEIDESALKQFTAGDLMQFEYKGVDTFQARPTARLVIATNSQPKFMDQADGVWRRMILLPFDYTVPMKDRDPHLTEKLLTELPGILNWAAEGERRRRATEGPIKVPKICEQAVAQYKEESSPTRMFFAEVLEKAPRDHYIRKADLQESYRLWCFNNGYLRTGSAKFYRAVEKHFGVKEDRTFEGHARVRVYRGLRFSIDSADAQHNQVMTRTEVGAAA